MIKKLLSSVAVMFIILLCSLNVSATNGSGIPFEDTIYHDFFNVSTNIESNQQGVKYNSSYYYINPTFSFNPARYGPYSNKKITFDNASVRIGSYDKRYMQIMKSSPLNNIEEDRYMLSTSYGLSGELGINVNKEMAGISGGVNGSIGGNYNREVSREIITTSYTHDLKQNTGTCAIWYLEADSLTNTVFETAHSINVPQYLVNSKTSKRLGYIMYLADMDFEEKKSSWGWSWTERKIGRIFAKYDIYIDNGNIKIKKSWDSVNIY